jgi:simple sugar transport system substrate-binding protein
LLLFSIDRNWNIFSTQFNVAIGSVRGATERMSHRLKMIWAACVALIAGTVIGYAALDRGQSSVAGTGGPADEQIVMVTHGQAADPYWNIVRSGAVEAAGQLGVRIDYRAPETFDTIRMAELIDSAVNQHPAALIVSIPDASALGPAIRRAVSAGVPVVSINSGAEVAAELGSLSHVGQDEYDTGRRVGERLRTEGAQKVICVNHEVGNSALDARCQGVADGFAGPVTVLPTSTEYQEVTSKVTAALAGDRSVDAIVALNASQVGEPAISSAQAAGRPVRVATFDTSPKFLQAVIDGKATFAVDPQAYLQGYLAIVLATNYVRHGVMPANRLIESGPRFVTKENAAVVLAASGKTIR